MTATAAARFLVSGRVQGVAFRAYTRAQAQALGLHGFARNLADGRVEVLAVGDAAAIERLAEWLHTGSPMARVDAVVRSEVTDADVRDAAAAGVFRVD
jgi:acylphosphatase